MNALQQLLMTARNRGWCVKPYCTTCGAQDYRRAIHADAEALVESLKTTRIRDLKHEFPTMHVDDALRLLMIELTNPVGPQFLKTRALQLELKGTDAGEYLECIRRHERELAEARARRQDYVSPEAVAERRRVKAERRRAVQVERAELKRTRETEDLAAIDGFSRLEAAAAIGRVMGGSVGFSLYRLRATQIEEMIQALGVLTHADLLSLRERVPKTRAAPLARLSSAIDRELLRAVT